PRERGVVTRARLGLEARVREVGVGLGLRADARGAEEHQRVLHALAEEPLPGLLVLAQDADVPRGWRAEEVEVLVCLRRILAHGRVTLRSETGTLSGSGPRVARRSALR